MQKIYELICTFVKWCNSNAGFFSLITSIIAIVISIRAISSQNKGVVFEKRLELYNRTEFIYQRCCRILNVCPQMDIRSQKNLIVAASLDYNSEEYKLAIKAIDLEQKMPSSSSEVHDKSDEFVKLVDKELSLYADRLADEKPFIEPLSLFYGKHISKIVEPMYRQYDQIGLGVIICNQSELNEWYKELNQSIDLMNKEHVLKKMKKKLPL